MPVCVSVAVLTGGFFFLSPVLVQRSTNSIASKFISGVQNLTFHSRAHRSHVRCIFAKKGKVWTGAGKRVFGTIKMWNESDKSLMGKFLCESRGNASLRRTMAAVLSDQLTRKNAPLSWFSG